MTKGKIHVELFKADWCGHCNRFIPNWNFLVDDPDLKQFVTFKLYEETKEKDAEHFKKNNISSFPTIKITYNGESILYGNNEKQREVDVMKQFLMDMHKKNEDNELIGGGHHVDYKYKYEKYKSKYEALKKKLNKKN